jgi:cupin 2 domain-containing protein
MKTGNLFDGASPPAEGERFDVLLDHRNLVVERIVSSADITPQTYVQPQDEWVVLVRGEALLDVDGEAVELKAGDHVYLPARLPHSVRRVSEGALWLAVHLHPEGR